MTCTKDETPFSWRIKRSVWDFCFGTGTWDIRDDISDMVSESRSRWKSLITEELVNEAMREIGMRDRRQEEQGIRDEALHMAFKYIREVQRNPQEYETIDDVKIAFEDAKREFYKHLLREYHEEARKNTGPILLGWSEYGTLEPKNAPLSSEVLTLICDDHNPTMYERARRVREFRLKNIDRVKFEQGDKTMNFKEAIKLLNKGEEVRRMDIGYIYSLDDKGSLVCRHPVCSQASYSEVSTQPEAMLALCEGQYELYPKTMNYLEMLKFVYHNQGKYVTRWAWDYKRFTPVVYVSDFELKSAYIHNLAAPHIYIPVDVDMDAKDWYVVGV